jgi:hypothetical protein
MPAHPTDPANPNEPDHPYMFVICLGHSMLDEKAKTEVQQSIMLERFGREVVDTHIDKHTHKCKRT